MSLTRCPDCRRLGFVDSASCPSCAAAEEKSFRRRGNIIMFLVPFVGALVALAVVLMRP